MSETQGVMSSQSLLEYFRLDSRPTREIAVAWRRGYRMERWTYARLSHTAVQFAHELSARGVAKGDRVLLWGENSGEWVAVFVGCVLAGAVVVPMDAIAEKFFAQRVARQSGVQIAVVSRSLPSQELGVPVIALQDLSEIVSRQPSANFPSPVLERNDPVEIVFTSGSTAEPRGVVLTHGNLLANLDPIEKEFARYRRYERIFHPLRFLDLLPLSHVFGQLLGIFIPQIFGATSVFLDTLNPGEVIRAIHSERVSVLITVPRLIESLGDQIERDLEGDGELDKFRRDFARAESEHFLKRWWRFRAIRRRFGWKFWAIISGGAALPAAAEQFWHRLGYAAIQGYGLTETTSLVSVNHPFRLGRGSIGKSLPGMEVKLSPESEILVRGENVAAGYWKETGIASMLDADGWFHTGDLGERDPGGNLYFKGREKNVIVTLAGLKIYPQDLEAELRKEPEVRDCVVVGVERDGNTEPCAALLLRGSSGDSESGTGAVSNANVSAIIERANARLAPFQQMRRWMVWHDADFPRTPTQKPILAQIRAAAEAQFGARSAASQSEASPLAPTGAASSPLGELLARISPIGWNTSNASAKLQLSSIERVELLGAMEDRYQVDLSEADFSNAETVGDLDRLLRQPSSRPPVFHYPRWAQSWPMRIVHSIAFNLLQRPAIFLFARPRILGRENLRGVQGPVLVVANHVTYLDPAFVIAALPGRLRRKLAVAMDGERLESMRKPPASTGYFAGLKNRANYFLIVALFNVFPLPLLSGFRKSFEFAGDLADRGWSILIFPEGALTLDGRIAPFRAGIGLLATRLRLPVVPVRVDGLFELKQVGKRRARPGQIKISIGTPVRFRESQPAEEIARQLEHCVTALGSGPD
jgi:long-chain acyl-CoA synthetase